MESILFLLWFLRFEFNVVAYSSSLAHVWPYTKIISNKERMKTKISFDMFEIFVVDSHHERPKWPCHFIAYACDFAVCEVESLAHGIFINLIVILCTQRDHHHRHIIFLLSSFTSSELREDGCGSACFIRRSAFIRWCEWSVLEQAKSWVLFYVQNVDA